MSFLTPPYITLFFLPLMLSGPPVQWTPPWWLLPPFNASHAQHSFLGQRSYNATSGISKYAPYLRVRTDC